MAHYSISKRSNKKGIVYYARVRSKENGVVTFCKSKSFHSKSAATKWAKELVHKVEKNLDEVDLEFIDITLSDLVIKYIEKKQSSDKPLGRTAVYSLKQTLNYSISTMLASKIKSKDIINFALERKNTKTSPSPSTISIDISCIRKVLRIAKSLFGIRVNDQCIIDAYPALHDLKLIARSSKRERRLEGNEFDKLLSELKAMENHHCCNIPYHDIFLLSILTCCRIGETCNLRWADIDKGNQTILVRDRKNPNGSHGNNSLLPLLGDSLSIMLNQPKTNSKIFPFNSRSITAGFRRARKRLALTDLRYHDLRREGASRLIEMGYSIEETARVTGHKDINVLWQVYVAINPTHFIRKTVEPLQ